MQDTLPTPEEYKHIRMIAQQRLQEVREQSVESLGLGIDIAIEDEPWAAQVHIWEELDDPERGYWKYELTQHELDASAQQ